MIKILNMNNKIIFVSEYQTKSFLVTLRWYLNYKQTFINKFTNFFENCVEKFRIQKKYVKL